MRRASRIDKPLTILLVILVVGGAFVFSSAAFGLLGRGETHITSVVFNHFALGLGLGLLALLLGLTVDYRIWRRYELSLYIAALALTALVFIPTLGLEHGGGTRWLDIFGFSFQPSEVLKVAAIIMAAAYFAGMKTKTATFSYGLGGFIGLMVAPAVLLLLQPDLGTLGVISISVLAVYIAAGARWRDVAIVIVLAMLALGAIAIMRPYVMLLLQSALADLVAAALVRACKNSHIFLSRWATRFSQLPLKNSDSSGPSALSRRSLRLHSVVSLWERAHPIFSGHSWLSAFRPISVQRR